MAGYGKQFKEYKCNSFLKKSTADFKPFFILSKLSRIILPSKSIIAPGDVFPKIYPVKHFIKRSWFSANPSKPYSDNSADNSSNLSCRSNSVLQLQAVSNWNESKGTPARLIRSNTIATWALSSVSISWTGIAISWKQACNLSSSIITSSSRSFVDRRYWTGSKREHRGKCFLGSTSSISSGTKQLCCGDSFVPIM